jgi:putative tryptophan/tyrosine transport system substrate-binding protein
MKRREFITLLGGAAAAWPLVARAQQIERIRRVAVLNTFAETDIEARAWDAAFRRQLEELGWVNGRDIHFEYRWSTGSIERTHLFAQELVQLRPDAILAVTTPATAALQKETHTIPIVFAIVSDPVGSGFVVSLARPGGNITGFVNIEGSLPGKWLDLLREIAPRVSRIGFMFNPQTAPYARYYLDTFRSAATMMTLEPIEVPIQNAKEIEAGMTMLGRDAGAGLIIMPDTSMQVHRKLIYSLADRHRLPTVYPFRFFVIEGGLMSYGIVLADLLRRAAVYIDRILRGATAGELPVQLPTKFEFVINLKTAKALNLEIPPTLLARADEVIE